MGEGEEAEGEVGDELGDDRGQTSRAWRPHEKGSCALSENHKQDEASGSLLSDPFGCPCDLSGKHALRSGG